MNLVDSNIIIYSAHPNNNWLRKHFINESYVSSISLVEVLGFNKLTAKDKNYFESLFQLLPCIHISSDIIQKAISLRQHHPISLADSLIAATTLTNHLVLITRNVNDFKHIRELKIFNPFD